MTLDYEEIVRNTHNARKGVAVVEEGLTERERLDIEFFVSDMENYIKKYADQGKTEFKYDCSKLDKKVFINLSRAFKEANGLFYVQHNNGTQTIIVRWGRSNEV